MRESVECVRSAARVLQPVCERVCYNDYACVNKLQEGEEGPDARVDGRVDAAPSMRGPSSSRKSPLSTNRRSRAIKLLPAPISPADPRRIVLRATRFIIPKFLSFFHALRSRSISDRSLSIANV